MADDLPSDVALMAALKDGDTAALATLIDRWQGRLLHFIFRYVQNEAVARDLVEEAFVRLYLSRQRFDGRRTFSTWLFGIAANLCRNHYRWFTRHRESPIETLPEQTDSVNPADLAGRREREQELAAAIHLLPHDLRVTVLLYYYDDLDYRAIARVVGCSVRGVESRLYRARKLLARSLRFAAASSASNRSASLLTSTRMPSRSR